MRFTLLCLVAALALTLELKGEDGLVKFDFDPTSNELFGVVMRGQIDPKNEMNNKIETFIRLANHYIPILESINNEANNLKWNYATAISIGPFTFNVYADFNLVVGWDVWLQSGNNGTSQVFNVVYAPFAWGWASSRNQLQSTVLGAGWYNGTLYYSRNYLNITLQIFGTGDVCFSGVANSWPVQIMTNLSASLQSCYTDILDDIIY